MRNTTILSEKEQWPELEWALQDLKYRITSDPEEALKARAGLLILDSGIGLDLCRKLREKETRPRLLVFDREPLDRLHLIALTAGADEWIHTDNLALFRKKVEQLMETHSEVTLLELPSWGIKLRPKDWLLTQHGEPVKLPKKEFELLALLMSEPEKMWSRRELMDRIWPESCSLDGTLNVHIRRLRAKLGEGLIRSQRELGYGIAP